jgi:ribosomal protein L20A (L18A)
MSLTGPQVKWITLLSDNRLYKEAVEYVERLREMPENSQLNGLMSYARDYDELSKFVKHQESKDTSSVNEKFYRGISGALRGLKVRIKECNLIPEDLSKKESRQLSKEIEGRLAFEYIRHLVAAALLKNAEQAAQGGRR